jgi:hypothetical protein
MPFPYSTEQIYNINSQRTTILPSSTITNLKEISTPAFAENFAQLGQEEKILFLTASRIYGDATLQIAKRAKSAKEAYDGLLVADDFMTSHYDRGEIRAFAQNQNTGPFGETYHFSSEMLRDRAQWFITAARLTNDYAFFNYATTLLDLAIENIPSVPKKNSLQTDPTATLIAFEKDLINYNLEQDLSTKRMLFEQLIISADFAILASSAAKNWERVATIAARMGYYISNQQENEIRGNQSATFNEFMIYFKNAVRNDNNLSQIWENEEIKLNSQSEQNSHWQQEVTSPIKEELLRRAIRCMETYNLQQV